MSVSLAKTLAIQADAHIARGRTLCGFPEIGVQLHLGCRQNPRVVFPSIPDSQPYCTSADNALRSHFSRSGRLFARTCHHTTIRQYGMLFRAQHRRGSTDPTVVPQGPCSMLGYTWSSNGSETRVNENSQFVQKLSLDRDISECHACGTGYSGRGHLGTVAVSPASRSARCTARGARCRFSDSPGSRQQRRHGLYARASMDVVKHIQASASQRRCTTRLPRDAASVPVELAGFQRTVVR